MISPSDRADIYYMIVEVSYKARKQNRSVKTWIVSSFEDPIDIMMYDVKTMKRLKLLFYKKSRAKYQPVTIERVMSKKFISKSQLTKDEKKGPDSSGHQ